MRVGCKSVIKETSFSSSGEKGSSGDLAIVKKGVSTTQDLPTTDCDQSAQMGGVHVKHNLLGCPSLQHDANSNSTMDLMQNYCILYSK